MKANVFIVGGVSHNTCITDNEGILSGSYQSVVIRNRHHLVQHSLGLMVLHVADISDSLRLGILENCLHLNQSLPINLQHILKMSP